MAIETGDLADTLMPPMTAGQFSDFERKVRTETADTILTALVEVLKDKTTPELITSILEDLKSEIYDL